MGREREGKKERKRYRDALIISHVDAYIYIYIYIEREREREREPYHER